MIQNKIILSTNNDLLDLATEKFALKKYIKYADSKIDIYEWIADNNAEKEKIIYINYLSKELDRVIDFINDNFDFQKLINIDLCLPLSNIEIKSWDIILPNTFISQNSEKKAIFLDNTIWWNYDLVKFGIILNWICVSNKDFDSNIIKEVSENDEFIGDIWDMDSYFILEKFNELKKDELVVFIRLVSWENNKENFNNLLNVLDLIL